LWLEKGIDPADALRRSITNSIARVSLALIWIYQGLVPKLLFRDSGELAILHHSHLFHGNESVILSFIGVGEILFGCALLLCWDSTLLLKINIALLAILGAGALFSQPQIFVAPFNPLTLSGAMIALAIIGLISSHDIPTSRRCKRRRQEKTL
jgi:hypothetical protein